MTTIDVMRLAEILREAATAEIMPRWRRLSPDMIRSKSNPSDLVTEADEEAERFIRARVASLAPTATFVGEESVAADPALLDKVAGAKLAVVVDPVDGTSNFAAGMPLFAVMAAVVVNGETVAGIIYDPFADDFVMAEKGSGAFVRRPDGTFFSVEGRSASALVGDDRHRVDDLPAASAPHRHIAQARQDARLPFRIAAPATNIGPLPAGTSISPSSAS